jgi:hypothetical protein
VNIGGTGNATGYTATAVAIVEHFDPFANAMVRDSFIIGGGTHANVISFAVGDLNPNVQYTGDAKIAIFNLGQHGILGGTGIPAVPFISKLLSTFGLYDQLTQSDTTNASFIVTDAGGAPIRPTDPSYITSLARNSRNRIFFDQQTSNKNNPHEIREYPVARIVSACTEFAKAGRDPARPPPTR